MGSAGRKWDLDRKVWAQESFPWLLLWRATPNQLPLSEGWPWLSSLSPAASNRHCCLLPLFGLEMSQLPIPSSPVALHCSLRFTYTLCFVCVCVWVGREREEEKNREREGERQDRDINIQEELKIERQRDRERFQKSKL